MDASQNVLIRENDCGTIHYETIDRHGSKSLFGDTFESKIFGKFTAEDTLDTLGKVIVPKDTLITKDVLSAITGSTAEKVSVRTILTCDTEE